MPPALEAQSLNHLTTTEVCKSATFFFFFLNSSVVVWALITLLHARQATLCSTHLLVQRQVVCSAGGATTQVLFMLVQRSCGMFSKVRPGMDPTAKEADTCGLPVCFRGRNCVLNRVSSRQFFFFFKPHLKISKWNSG